MLKRDVMTKLRVTSSFGTEMASKLFYICDLFLHFATLSGSYFAHSQNGFHPVVLIFHLCLTSVNLPVLASIVHGNKCKSENDSIGRQNDNNTHFNTNNTNDSFQYQNNRA
jgi:hypothetical protein